MFWLKKYKRKRIAERPFPDTWENILQTDAAIYNILNDEDKAELQGHISIFLAEKYFEPCRGFVITERVKVIIAAYACVLLLHRQTDYYPGLYSILVYPDAFITNHKEYLDGGLIAEGPEVLSGQSSHRGTVVLSWDDVEYDRLNINDGRNVIYHEFAHQIDTSGGKGDSSIVLKNNANFAAWAKILYKNYMKLRDDAEFDAPSLLDKYGATDPSEFFAVVTEFFFEKPIELYDDNPQLYNELMRFYNEDPIIFV
ncbi:MAG: M90 family metallopeptidase [Phycisphaerales bacterium]